MMDIALAAAGDRIAPAIIKGGFGLMRVPGGFAAVPVSALECVWRPTEAH
jgi:hypothetical protein